MAFKKLKNRIRLLREEENLPNVLPILQSVGLPLKEDNIQYNGGFMAFRKTETTQVFFDKFKYYFEIVKNNQDKLLLKDQIAFLESRLTPDIPA